MNVSCVHRPVRMEQLASGECRLCGSPLRHTFVDLGMSPLCESLRTAEQLDQMEAYFPLHVLVCEQCFLVQLKQYVSPEHIFREYAYSEKPKPSKKASKDDVVIEDIGDEPINLDDIPF